MKLRCINKEEKQQLKDYFINNLGYDQETANNTVDNYWYGVFEDYISDGPAYADKIIFAVYGCPEFYEVFIVQDGKLTHLNTDMNIKKEV